MRGLPEIPDEDVAEYWQLVRDALVAGGVSKREAVAMAKAYREYMKPASWTIYNTDPEDSAEAAKDYAAWMREEAEQAAPKSKAAPKRAKKIEQNFEWPPSEHDLERLPRWASVAFAARCARRVTPLFKEQWPAVPVEHIVAVTNTVEVVESAAALATAQLKTVEKAIGWANAAQFDAMTSDAPGFVPLAAGNAARTISTKSDGIQSVLASYNAFGDLGYPTPSFQHDFQLLRSACQRRKLTDDTPVPPAVFGPLWPEGPPAGWPELPKPTKLKLSVQVPDNLDDAAVREKLQQLTTALARLNVAGGGHGLKLVPPIDFTHEQDKGRADVVREESEKPKGRGNARRGR